MDSRMDTGQAVGQNLVKLVDMHDGPFILDTYYTYHFICQEVIIVSRVGYVFLSFACSGLFVKLYTFLFEGCPSIIYIHKLYQKIEILVFHSGYLQKINKLIHVMLSFFCMFYCITYHTHAMYNTKKDMNLSPNFGDFI